MELENIILIFLLNVCVFSNEVLAQTECSDFTLSSCDLENCEITKNFTAITGPAQCQQLCGLFPSSVCNMFDYQETSKDCLLYTCTVSAFAATCKTVTGPKFPSLSECQIEEPANCKSFRKSECIYKGAIDSIQTITDAETCQEFCQLLADCAYYAFTETNKTCDLHKEGEVICTSFLGPRLPTLLECQGISTTSTGTTTATTTPIATTTSEQSGSGYVALVVGDNDSPSVELFSPNGKCNHLLAPLPFAAAKNPVLVYLNQRIISCAGSYSCWQYHPEQNSWSGVASAPFSSAAMPGAVYNNKVYIVDSFNGHVFYPTTDTWSIWTYPPVDPGFAPWMVSWNDRTLIFGGSNYPRGVQSFNHNTQQWQILDSSQAPFQMYWSSCLNIQQTDEILIVGSALTPHYYSAALYNARTNQWTELEKTAANRSGSRLVMLGQRIFAIGGDKTELVEEFFLSNYTWKSVEPKLQVVRGGYHTLLALPASLFAHLGCEGIE